MVQKAWERRSEYWVVETNAVFFEKIDTIAAEGYIPTEEDVLACRVSTSGFYQENYVIDDIDFVMIGECNTPFRKACLYDSLLTLLHHIRCWWPAHGAQEVDPLFRWGERCYFRCRLE